MRTKRKAGSNRCGSGQVGRDPQHPGLVLAEVLGDTPAASAAKWFGKTPDEVKAVLEGRAPMDAAMCAAAGSIFGTGSGPWLEMQRLWDEANAPKTPTGECIPEEVQKS